MQDVRKKALMGFITAPSIHDMNHIRPSYYLGFFRYSILSYLVAGGMGSKDIRGWDGIRINAEVAE